MSFLNTNELTKEELEKMSDKELLKEVYGDFSNKKKEDLLDWDFKESALKFFICSGWLTPNQRKALIESHIELLNRC